MEHKISLTSFGLKRVAVASMIIDHIKSILLPAVFLAVGTDAPILRQLLVGRELCDILGRVAFPVFCFLIVEGFLHTRDRVGYGLRMGLFALISEIPYDLAHYQIPFSLRLQNVMFTLTVGIVALLFISKAEERWKDTPALRWFATAAVTGAGMALNFWLRGEYVYLGVVSMVLVYLLRNRGKLRVAGLAPLLVVSPWTLLAVPFLLLYNGERGKGSKWFFYVFYPVHFLVLFALATWLSGSV